MIRFVSLAVHILEGVQSSLWLRDQIKHGKKQRPVEVQGWYGGPSFWNRQRELENLKETGYVEVEINRQTTE